MASSAQAPVVAQWQDSDFFKLNLDGVEKLKKQIASKLKLRYSNVNGSSPFAEPSAGIAPFSETGYDEAVAAYKEAAVIDDPATRDISMANACCKVFTVSGCQVLWRPLIPANEGYVLKWMETNVDHWDSAMERKAAAVDPSQKPSHIEFAVTSSSSLLALIVATVSAYKRTNDIPAALAQAFSRIRLCVYFNAAAEEIDIVNQIENIEQHERKRHTEIDNIMAVSTWMDSLLRLSESQLSPNSALDIVKFAVILGDPRRPSSTPVWLSNELTKLNYTNTLENRVKAVCQKHVTKKFLQDNKASPIHPQMNSYAAVVTRHRFLKGFDREALQILVKDLFGRAGREGYAAKSTPLSRTVICSDHILTSEAFSNAAEKQSVPSWRDSQVSIQN